MICQACRDQRHEDCLALPASAHGGSGAARGAGPVDDLAPETGGPARHEPLTADTSDVLDQRATWCDCQHKPPKPVEPATGAAGE
jgi:hypothetical protein